MNIEDQLSNDLKELTRDVPGGLSLDRAIAIGRSRRRTHHIVAGVGACALVSAVSLGASGLVAGLGTHDDASGELQPAAVTHGHSGVTAEAPRDFVPGTDIDETMQTVINNHLDLSMAASVTNVYPSDRQHNGPIPDDQWPYATDWQVVYGLPGGQRLLVIMFYPRPDEPYSGQTAPQLYNVNDTYYQTSGTTELHDGVSVNTILSVEAQSADEARNKYMLTVAELQDISQDNGLTFPEPVNPPS